MSGRVVGHDGLAARHVHIRREAVAELDRARGQLAEVRKRGAAFLRVGDRELRAHVAELARVADLAAGLRIERSAVEHDFAFVAGVERLHCRAALEQRDDLADVGGGFVAEEVRLVFEANAARHVDAELARGLRLLALHFHRGFVAGVVDGQAALARDVGGEVDRKAVGVVELEDGFAVERLAAFDDGKRAVEQLHAVRERLRETLFFLLEHARGERLAGS